MSFVTLITGASSGFGRILAEDLARAGHEVYATMRDANGRNAGPAAELAGIPGIRVLELDVIDEGSTTAAVETALSTSGRLDVVVNNAGFGGFGLTEAFTVEQWESVFATNLFGVVRVNRAVLPAMRRQASGLLVHVTSLAGRIPLLYLGAYCSSKWALEAYAEVLRLELAPCGIDSVVVEPGKYRTGILDKTMFPADAARAAEYGPADRTGDFLQAFVADMDRLNQNPAEVSHAIRALIEMPPGERPFRTIVGADGQPMGPYNEAADQLRQVVAESLGLADLLTLQRRGAAAG